MAAPVPVAEPEPEPGAPRVMRRRRFALVTYDAAPTYLRGNPYITHGYRADYSVASCVLSIGKLHNETANIHSHLVPMFGALALLVSLVWGNFFGLLERAMGNPLLIARPSDPRAEAGDVVLFGLFLLAVTVCFGCSATYHTFNAHCQASARRLVTVDYMGIFALVAGSYLAPTAYGFTCWPGWGRFYVTTISVLSGAALVGPCFERYHAPSFRAARIALFCALAASGMVPLAHFAFVANAFGLLSGRSLVAVGRDALAAARCFELAPHRLVAQTLPLPDGLAMFDAISLVVGLRIIGLYLIYALAVTVFAFRVPERWFPGRFNVIGHSHMLMHVICVAACVYHLVTIAFLFAVGPVTSSLCSTR